MDTEFKSKLEDLVDRVFELKFPASAGFRPLSTFFSPESVAHPAKANLFLVSFLISKYTKGQDVILDPMAGSGSTGVVASYLGRHSVLVELEEKFCSWIEENVACLEKHGGKKGEIKVLKGDARKLTDLLCVKADAIVTSPPYSNIAKSKEGAISPHMQGLISKLSGMPVKEFAHDVEKLKKAVEIAQSKIPFRYSDSPNNIGNLPHGEISTIITSPPYSQQNIRDISKEPYGSKLTGGAQRNIRQVKPYSENPKNIGNLSHGEVDIIITSPPYADSKKQPSKIDLEKEVSSMETDTRPDTKNRHTPGREKAIKSLLSGYSESKENIGNLPLGEVDAVITSPPYSEALSAKSGGMRGKFNAPKTEPTTPATQEHGGLPQLYSENKAQIGNLRHGDIDAILTSPPYSESMSKKRKGHSVYPNLERTREMPQETRDDNIANLYHGDIDAVITSPPYADGTKGKSRSPLWERLAEDPTSNRYGRKKHPTTGEGYSKSKENIGNLPHGEIDAIITSPPYDGSVSDDKEGPSAGADEKKYGRWRRGTAKKQSYTQHEEPCKVDAIITSPPYEGSLEGTTRHTRGGIASRDPALAQTGSYATVMSFGVPVGYSPNKDNIGNLKSNEEEYKALDHGDIDAVITSPPYSDAISRQGGPTGVSRVGVSTKTAREYSDNPGNLGNVKGETYLSEMLKCYQQCFQVLKFGGRVIIIVKPFVRNKKPIDLPYHTWLLLEKCGFNLVDVLKFRLPTQSFWRVLQYQKYPEIERINHEYIIVAQKPEFFR